MSPLFVNQQMDHIPFDVQLGIKKTLPMLSLKEGLAQFLAYGHSP